MMRDIFSGLRKKEAVAIRNTSRITIERQYRKHGIIYHINTKKQPMA